MNQNKDSDLLHHERVQEILKNIPPILKKFPPEDLRGFLKTGELEFYSPGQIIISEGSMKSNEGWLPTEGILSIWKENIELARIGPGHFIGEAFLFTPSTRSATVKAETDVALIRFERDAVLRFFRSRPERLFKIFVMNLLEIQHQKITTMNNKVARLQKKLFEVGSDTLK